ncbi:MAG: FG-GAP-like repeat-containing protein [Bacteroidales bacterium]|jgi:RHS repeat-associated protein|nr:FG-GAP-like repeat-containing protein [Bacteroidales bacterium]
MKKNIYISLLILIYLLLSENPFYGQNSCDPLIKTNQHSGNSFDYVSKENVHFKHGFSYKPTGSNSLKASTDPYQICELNSQHIVNGYNSQNQYQHNNSLPVGSIPGIADVSATGAATYTIPIYASPGTAGMEPSISVTYNSQSGNGILGMGWHITGLSAISLTSNSYYNDGYFEAVKFNNASTPKDRYSIRYALDGNRLVRTGGTYGQSGSVYRTEIETFARINYDNDIFKVYSKNGYISHYGNNNNSRYKITSGNNSKTLNWLINKIEDRNGNYINYEYYEIGGERQIKKISYTGTTNFGPYNSIEFFYSERDDVSTAYVSGTEIKQSVLLNRIDIKHNGFLVKKYVFKYMLEDGYPAKLSEITEYDSDGNYLNSTVIEWNSKGTASINTIGAEYDFLQSPITSGPFISWVSGDFNGNGLRDFAAVINYAYTSFGEPIKNSWFIAYLNNGNGTFSKEQRCLSEDNFYGIYSGDFNNDGLDEILLTDQKNGKTDRLYIDLDYNSYLWSSENYMAQSSAEGIKRIFLSGNFYGNGKKSMFFMQKDKIGNSFISETILTTYDSIGNIIDGIPATKIYNYSENKLSYNPVSLDFDGDGITDFINIDNNSLKIYEFNLTTRILDVLYEIPGSIINFDNFLLPESYKNFKFGDINGDGKTDLMVKQAGTKVNTWKVYISDGTKYIEKGTFYPDTYYSVIYLADMNGDGMADIIDTYDINPMKIRINLSYGDGTFKALNVINASGNGDIVCPLGFDDFDGDGITDIVYGKTRPSICYHNKNDKSRMVKKITDGFKNINEFTYTTIAKHNREINFPVSSNFNMADTYLLTGPLNVVSIFKQSTGLNSTTLSQTSYQYRNGRIHYYGKGFLGFGEIIAKNTTSNLYKTIQNTFNYEHYVISTTRITTGTGTIPYSGTIISVQSSQMLIKQMDISAYPAWLAMLPQTQTETDYSGYCENYVRTTYNYMNLNSGTFLGNPESIKVDYAGVHEVTTNFSGYSSAGSWCASKPSVIKETRKLTGYNDNFVTKKTISYNSNGTIYQIISDSDPSGEKPLTERFTYDNHGNITNKLTIGRDGESTTTAQRSVSFEYDRYKRFVTVSTNDNTGLSETMAYDPLYGNIIKHTDDYGNLTRYEYDGFGNIIKIHSPTGHTTDIERAWENSVQNNVAYSVTTTSPGRPQTKVWYDILGREIKSSTDFYNQTIVTEKQYNPDGTLYKESLPYFSTGSASRWKTYSYNASKRPVSISSLNLTTQYSYGTKSETITYPDGTYYTINTNNAGQTTNVTSSEGSINYLYHSTGQPKKITANGIVTDMEYDEYGRQSALIDANSGRTEYEYNAFGELIKQTDAKQSYFKFVYDNAGRLINETCNNITFSKTYTYYTSGDSKGMLQKESMNNNTYREYTYDNYGNITYIKEYIGGNTFNHYYTYDQYNNPETYTYPSGFKINKTYNPCGYLTKVSEESTSTGAVWQVSGSGYINEAGQLLNYKLGPNNINTTYSYNTYYELTRITSGNFFDYSYSFNHTKGTLTSRTDNKTGKYESFTYDNTNRLKTWQVSGQTQQSITYDINSGNKGNITEKSDVGTYVYKGDKPHAVSEVYGNNVFGLQSVNNQYVTFNPLHKASQIREGTNIYKCDIIYGADSQRKRTLLYQNNALKVTKYYSGLYEKEITAGGDTREIHYIPGGDGIAAVHIITNGNSQSGVTYYLAKDHLGSVMAVTDKDQNIVRSHSYDAWGNMRDYTTWSYDNVNTDFIVNRGFTGHEMLPEFGLINMNGRLYDPVIAMVISPDNYVQAPGNAYNYNRYSYCLNNPLKYTDPSGELIFGFLRSVVDAIKHGDISRMDPTLKGTAINNSIRIWGGLFITDPNKQGNGGRIWEFVSRFTWQAPNTLAGFFTGHFTNTFKDVYSVDYFGGATVLETSWKKGSFSLGSYIQLSKYHSIYESYLDPISGEEKEGLGATFIHEYGHYIQSQKVGPFYAIKYALPSVFTNNYTKPETDANMRAYGYFSKYYSHKMPVYEKYIFNPDTGTYDRKISDWNNDRYPKSHNNLKWWEALIPPLWPFMPLWNY